MVLTETESIFGAPLSRHCFVTFPSLLHLHSFPPCLFPARNVRVEERYSASHVPRLRCSTSRAEDCWRTTGQHFFLLHTYLFCHFPSQPLSLSLCFSLSFSFSFSLFLPLPLYFRLYAEPLSDFALRRTLCCCPTILFLPSSPFPPSLAPHTHPLLRDGRLSEPKHAASHSSHRGQPTSIRQFSSSDLAFLLDNSEREP